MKGQFLRKMVTVKNKEINPLLWARKKSGRDM